MTWADVQAAFPRDTVLTTIDETEGALYLQLAAEQADEALLESRYELLLKLLAAHYGRAINDGGSASTGEITAEAVDGVSRSYAQTSTAPGETDADWSTTSYGKRALALLRATPAARLPRAY